MPYKNLEERKRSWQEYYLEHKEQILEKNRAWAKSEIGKAYFRRYYHLKQKLRKQKDLLEEGGE